MSERRIVFDADTETHYVAYSRDDIRAAWGNDSLESNKIARGRGGMCVITPDCSEDNALEISALFVRNVYACPECTHYDGRNVSLYCGQAGSGAGRAMGAARSLVAGFFAIKPQPAYGPLWA